MVLEPLCVRRFSSTLGLINVIQDAHLEQKAHEENPQARGLD
jgi:hypothetical protein